MGGGGFRRTVELLCEGAIKNVVDERGFAGAGDAGDDGKHAERKSNVDVLQIVGAGAENLNRFAIGAATFFGDGDFGGTTQILTGEGFRRVFDLLRLAPRDEIA